MDWGHSKVHTQRGMEIPAWKGRVKSPAAANAVLSEYTNNQKKNPPKKNPKGHVIEPGENHVGHIIDRGQYEIGHTPHSDGHYKAKYNYETMCSNYAIIKMAITK